MTSTLTKLVVSLSPRFRSKLRNKISGRNGKWKLLRKLKPPRKRKKLMWNLKLRKKIKMWNCRNKNKKLKSQQKIRRKTQKKIWRRKSKRLRSLSNSKNKHQIRLTNLPRKKRRTRMKKRWIVQLWPTQHPETWKNRKNYFLVRTAHTTHNLSMITLKWHRNYWPTIRNHLKSSW